MLTILATLIILIRLKHAETTMVHVSSASALRGRRLGAMVTADRTTILEGTLKGGALRPAGDLQIETTLANAAASFSARLGTTPPIRTVRMDEMKTERNGRTRMDLRVTFEH